MAACKRAGHGTRLRQMPPSSSIFDQGAGDYRRYRPRYPPELFEYLARLSPRRKLVWDCGTGNGQAAISLARDFSRVIATDASRDQLHFAEPHERIDYRVAKAEDSGLDTGSVDLITVAQALHWFDLSEFYREARRVASGPDAVIAAGCYPLPRIEPQIDALIEEFYEAVVQRRWQEQDEAVRLGYRNIEFPFQELAASEFTCAAEWDLAQVMGFIQSWSPVRLAARETGDATLQFAEVLASAWGNGLSKRWVRWPILMRAGRVGVGEGFQIS